VDSIQSAWVQEEIEAASKIASQRKRLVLFPVYVDDSLLETQVAWAASTRRTHHIGDFRDWKDPGHYESAFEKLLHDLKPPHPET
jgi:hypothetical protein